MRKLCALLTAFILAASLCLSDSFSAYSEASFDEEAYSYEVVQPLDFTLDYERSNPLLARIMGENTVEDARSMIRAFLAGETSAKVNPGNMHPEAYTEHLGYLLDIMCPPFHGLADYRPITAYKNGSVHWRFRYDEKETQRLLEDFEDKVTDFMSGIDQRDSETARAFQLYKTLTLTGEYDYEYAQTEHAADEIPVNASYFAIAENRGICTTYAIALSFLYTQVGIDALTILAFQPMHAWTLCRLDGEYYYLDPTFDLGGGLFHFGMTQEDRILSGGYYFEPSLFTICAKPVPEDLLPTSQRFGILRSALDMGYTEYHVDHDAQQIIIPHLELAIECR